MQKIVRTYTIPKTIQSEADIDLYINKCVYELGFHKRPYRALERKDSVRVEELGERRFRLHYSGELQGEQEHFDRLDSLTAASVEKESASGKSDSSLSAGDKGSGNSKHPK